MVEGREVEGRREERLVIKGELESPEAGGWGVLQFSFHGVVGRNGRQLQQVTGRVHRKKQ